MTTAIVGVREHGNSAELVTIGTDFSAIDRRRINLTIDLPTMPYHHQGSWAIGRYKDSAWAKDISLGDAIALIEKVKIAADEGAKAALEALAKKIPIAISAIAIRTCPELPDTIEATIRDNRAQTYADTVMYRMALANAAGNLGWAVHWYDKNKIFDEAAQKLNTPDIAATLKEMGKTFGPPWQAKHKMAAAAAIAACP